MKDNQKFKILSLGFTLIELMIVMVIMGILITIGLTTFKSSSQKGRDSRRKSDLRQVQTALETYYADKGQYPVDDGAGKMKGCGAGAVEPCNWGSAFSNTTNNTMYMVKLPKDPTSNLQYYYVKSGNGYKFYAHLENSQDPSLITPSVFTNCSTSAVVLDCNYGVASTNVTP